MKIWMILRFLSKGKDKIFMRRSAYHILRIGLAVTFIWIGILIYKSPEVWGGFLRPFAIDLLSTSLREIMLATAIFDIGVGILLLFNIFTPIASILASLHLAIIIVTSSFNDVIVRDMGLLSASIALAISSWRK